jgi:hypothetical protein
MLPVGIGGCCNEERVHLMRKIITLDYFFFIIKRTKFKKRRIFFTLKKNTYFVVKKRLFSCVYLYTVYTVEFKISQKFCCRVHSLGHNAPHWRLLRRRVLRSAARSLPRVFTKVAFGISRKSKFYTKMVLISRNFE